MFEAFYGFAVTRFVVVTGDLQVIRSNDRDIGLGTAKSKDELFAVFGPDAARARELYDPRGDQTLEELLVQVFMDSTMTEPARHLANELARAGQSV